MRIPLLCKPECAKVLFSAVRRFGATGLALCFVLVSHCSMASPSRTDEIANIARLIAGTRIAGSGYLNGGVGEVQLSPNGQWVIYSVQEPDLSKNDIRTALFLKSVRGGSEAVSLPNGIAQPRWSPDGALLAAQLGSNLVLFRFSNGKLIEFRRRTITGKLENSTARQPFTFKWSPDSRRIAFITRNNVDQSSWSGGLTGEEWDLRRADRYTLEIYDVRTNAITHLLPAEKTGPQPVAPYLNDVTAGMDWSPDSRSLVVCLNRDPRRQGDSVSLAILDTRSKTLKPFAELAGINSEPIWSPDGSMIAFSSEEGKPDWFIEKRPAIYDVRKQTVFYLHDAPRGSAVRWSADSRSIIWSSRSDMTTRLSRIDVFSKSTVVLPSPIDESGPLSDDLTRSFSSNGRVMAFARSYFAQPSDVYVTDLDHDSVPQGIARRLTFVGRDLTDLAAKVRSQEISWKSRDGEFVIHGLLVEPVNAPSNANLATVLWLEGGPSMVERGFMRFEGSTMTLAMAAAGYAVLIPNTRGRDGYGDRLEAGIRADHSYARLPLNDALDGINMIVRKGIADPNRLAVAGTSYGGYLTEYALTQSTMFKAAIVHEGHLADLSNYLYAPYYPSGSVGQILSRDLYGFEDPASAAEFKRLIDESPGFHPQNVRTPTLLLFGAQSLAATVGEQLYAQYEHFRVPSQLVVYDEGHWFAKPANIVDSIVRTISWIDRWMAAPNANKSNPIH
ncbi:MAG: prolyl oligopeptidase family serine peptidase [Rhizomicrobium sp.]